MSLSTPIHPLTIPTTLSINRSSRNLDCDNYSNQRDSSSSPCVTPTSPDSKVILNQTELVYDQLLADRQRKLQRRIDEKKQQLDEKVQELESTDVQKAAEFKRWADAALIQMEAECAIELQRLREDYERKFFQMERSLQLVPQQPHPLTSQ